VCSVESILKTPQDNPINRKLLGITYSALNLGKGKGKSIPLQALTDPEGSRRLTLPDFKAIST
jgi:hypothetical protein